MLVKRQIVSFLTELMNSLQYVTSIQNIASQNLWMQLIIGEPQ